MSLLIVSPGRCGSAWLSSFLAGCSLSVNHEWTGSMLPFPDVIADTSWLWNQDSFLKSLRTEDYIIVLDRSAAQRTASVERLLGPHDWSALEDHWQAFKAKLAMLEDVTWIDYADLFTTKGKEAIFKTLWYHTGHPTGNFDNLWNLYRHMKITNHRAETDVKDSYGIKE